MVKLTLIARVIDGLPLAEGLDDSRDLKDAEFYKQQVKALFKNLSRGQNEASRMSIETGPYIFQYPCEIFHVCVCVCVYVFSQYYLWEIETTVLFLVQSGVCNLFIV